MTNKRKHFIKLNKKISRDCRGLLPWGGSLMHYCGVTYDKYGDPFTIEVFSRCKAFIPTNHTDDWTKVNCPLCLKKRPTEM